MDIAFTLYCFGPSDTIRGVIRKLNSHNMEESLMQLLLIKYNEFNNNEVPRPGRQAKIPVLPQYVKPSTIKDK